MFSQQEKEPLVIELLNSARMCKNKYNDRIEIPRILKVIIKEDSFCNVLSGEETELTISDDAKCHIYMMKDFYSRDKSSIKVNASGNSYVKVDGSFDLTGEMKGTSKLEVIKYWCNKWDDSKMVFSNKRQQYKAVTNLE